MARDNRIGCGGLLLVWLFVSVLVAGGVWLYGTLFDSHQAAPHSHHSAAPPSRVTTTTICIQNKTIECWGPGPTPAVLAAEAQWSADLMAFDSTSAAFAKEAKALPASTTDEQFEAAAQPVLKAMSVLSHRLAAYAWPGIVVASDVHSVVLALAHVAADVRAADIISASWAKRFDQNSNAVLADEKVVLGDLNRCERLGTC